MHPTPYGIWTTCQPVSSWGMEGDRLKLGIGLTVVTVLGALTAAALMPKVFTRIETDLERTKFLLKSVAEIKAGTLPAPDMVVLGNSVTMNGVDTALVAQGLPGNPLVYNFSSTGQSVAEGYLYLQELPEKTKTVVLVVSPGNLETDLMPPQDVYNTFYMQGYRSNAKTVAALRGVYTEEVTGSKDWLSTAAKPEFLSEGDLQQRFHARWAISQMPDTELRKKIRRDLETGKSIKSLTYPAPYTKRIPDASFEKLLPTYNKPRKSKEFSPLATQIKLINTIAAEVRASGRSFRIVLAPMHPRRLSFAGPDFVSSMHRWAASSPFGADVPVLNLSESLTDAQFIDVVHPSREGAETLSRAIGEFLAR